LINTNKKRNTRPTASIIGKNKPESADPSTANTHRALSLADC
jgi:hypothetical protein